MRDELPVDGVIPECLKALRGADGLVLHAPPGAGKTTRIPPALLDLCADTEGRVIVLEPRRIAARAAAHRIAEERGERVGETVGYRIRFEHRVSPRTRLEVVTEGVLLQRLLADPYLEGVQFVVFDEFHERRLDSDLALAMTRRIQQTVRPDLKLVVMSATLEPEPIAAWLGGCPIVRSAGRRYPVTTESLRRVERQPLPQLAAMGVRQVLERTDGDVLVFLPGVGEILRTRDELSAAARRQAFDVMPLFGEMTSQEQDRVLRQGARRKVVLATNVAETSVTIEGITGVVDTGVARQRQFSSHLGLDRLELIPISRAAAEQRAGRAGRTAPGYCLRLWDAATDRHRPDYETAEVRRVDLSAAVLRLLAWGERDIRDFPWFEPPTEAALRHAERLLERLGAVDTGGLTDLGRQLARLPVAPRLGRLLVEAARLGVRRRGTLLAALLSERDPFRRSPADSGRAARGGAPRTVASRRSRSDLLDRVAAIEDHLRANRLQFDAGEIHPGAVRTIERAARQMDRMLNDAVADDTVASVGAADPDEALLRAVAVAFSDRIARRRDPGSDRGLMTGGRGVRLHPRSAVREAEFFACVDVDDRDADASVRLASEVRPEWLPPALFRTTDELFFHPSRKRVVARRIFALEDLVLQSTPTAVEDDAAAAEILFRATRNQLSELLHAHPEAVQFVTRINCLAEWMPESELPVFDEPRLEYVLRRLCLQCRSVDELKKADWLTAIREELPYEAQRFVEQQAPERLQVPGGSRIRLEYRSGAAPVLAVRIQEMFGEEQTPRIAGGRVPVLLHLLAPNQRVQQVTDDLASFWSGAWHQVRKDLKRRYPKHAWPEDPLSAPPVRR